MQVAGFGRPNVTALPLLRLDSVACSDGEDGMRLLLGLSLLIGGIGALLAVRPKNGKPRPFVGTNMEVPVAISVVLALGVGVVLTIGGLWEVR